MNENMILFSAFLIFAGASILSTLALYGRQALFVAYILVGVLLGPWGLKLIANVDIVNKIGHIGIIFLLFLLGLNLNPRDLLKMFGQVVWTTLLSSLIFAAVISLACYKFGFNAQNSIITGMALMFSSTIISLKLLPSSILQEERSGELIISILLLQDVLAILVLLVFDFAKVGDISLYKIAVTTVLIPVLFTIALLFTRLILMKLFTKFDHVNEYIFLAAIGWCLSFAELAKLLGLSYEIGAFIAGVAIATGPVSLYLSENLKPLRDFFLVMFFFSIGAGFDLQVFKVILLPILVVTGLLILLKPIIFKFLLAYNGEDRQTSWEVGFRLGQASCFSLLVSRLAYLDGFITQSTMQLIHAVTVLTFIFSSYIIVLFFPTPIALSKKLLIED